MSPDGKHTEQLVDTEQILVIEFDYAFATDTPGDPNRKISMMVATDSIHGSIFAVVAGRNGSQDNYVMQSVQNFFDRLCLVKAELKCYQEPSTLDVANALVKRCQSTILMVIATPKVSKGSLGRGERANLTIQGQPRTFREAVSMKKETEIGPDHVLMSWMVRHCAWVVNHFQVKGTGRTPYRSIRGKDYTGEVVPFGDMYLGRNHSEDGAKFNMRWMRGVFVGKLDRTDEFLLLTPTGAMKTRFVRRLEGNNAGDLQFSNLCIGHPRNATARSMQQEPTIQSKDALTSGRRAKRLYLRQDIMDRYGRSVGCPGWLGIGQHTEECRPRIEQEMLDKGEAVRIVASEDIVQEPDASLKKRRVGEPDVNPGGASSLTADLPRRSESEQGISAENACVLAGCIAAVNKRLCVDLSRDRTALSGKFPEHELRAGRELELRNMKNFDAFELVEELLPGKYVYDIFWVDEWRGDRVRSRLCVR